MTLFLLLFILFYFILFESLKAFNIEPSLEEVKHFFLTWLEIKTQGQAFF